MTRLEYRLWQTAALLAILGIALLMVYGCGPSERTRQTAVDRMACDQGQASACIAFQDDLARRHRMVCGRTFFNLVTCREI